MAITKRRQAAKRNVSKAKVQPARRDRSSRSRGRALPSRRAKPGARGRGEFFHVEVRPRREFLTFRTQDVGKKGGIERVAGKRADGSWDTQKWLISKELAHLAHGRLVPDTADARMVLSRLGVGPRHVGGDRFKANDRSNVSKRVRSTPAIHRAQQRNIRKAQAGKRGRR
jgi:hypothetical protein